MPRIVRDMKPADFEHRAMDLIETIPAPDRQRFARFLRLYALTGGSGREIDSLATRVEEAR